MKREKCVNVRKTVYKIQVRLWGRRVGTKPFSLAALGSDPQLGIGPGRRWWEIDVLTTWPPEHPPRRLDRTTHRHTVNTKSLKNRHESLALTSSDNVLAFTHVLGRQFIFYYESLKAKTVEASGAQTKIRGQTNQEDTHGVVYIDAFGDKWQHVHMAHKLKAKQKQTLEIQIKGSALKIYHIQYGVMWTSSLCFMASQVLEVLLM